MAIEEIAISSLPSGLLAQRLFVHLLHAIKHTLKVKLRLCTPPRKLTHRLYDLLFTRRADMQRRTYTPAFRDRLKQALREQRFDLVQIESLEMAAYLPVIKAIQPDTPIIYDSFNAEFALQRSVYEAERHSVRRVVGALYSRTQWRRLEQFERQVCQTVTYTNTGSHTEPIFYRARVWLEGQ